MLLLVINKIYMYVLLLVINKIYIYVHYVTVLSKKNQMKYFMLHLPNEFI